MTPEPPRMKTTTDIPDSITMPDCIETRIGPLEPWFDKTWRPGKTEMLQSAAN
jgi:hypothetical protein